MVFKFVLGVGGSKDEFKTHNIGMDAFPSRIETVEQTCTHYVVSEEWGSKPKGQHEQVAGEAWK